MSAGPKRGYTRPRHAPVAQGIERSPAEAEATGSIPVGRTSPSWMAAGNARARPPPFPAGHCPRGSPVRRREISRFHAYVLAGDATVSSAVMISAPKHAVSPAFAHADARERGHA